MGREGKSGCPVLSPSPLPCPSFSILLSRRIHRFLPLPARPPNLDRPLPSRSLSFPAFLSSLHFLVLPHSLLFIHFPESTGGFNFQNDYKEQVQEERWKPKYSGPLRLEFFSLKRHLLGLPKDTILSEQRPPSCQKEQIAFPSELSYLRHGGSSGGNAEIWETLPPHGEWATPREGFTGTLRWGGPALCSVAFRKVPTSLKSRHFGNFSERRGLITWDGWIQLT